VGPEWPVGDVVNPWLNPFYHHGPGVLSFFYPPDPRGPALEPTDLVIPSYRLPLMRDGNEIFALLEVLRSGVDDQGNNLKVDQAKLAKAEKIIEQLWPQNTVQWYLSYSDFRKAVELLYDSCTE
jgi:hypothetical protein